MRHESCFKRLKVGDVLHIWTDYQHGMVAPWSTDAVELEQFPILGFDTCKIPMVVSHFTRNQITAPPIWVIRIEKAVRQ